MEQIFNTLIWAAILQGFLLAMLYIFSKKHSSLSNKLLGLFLLAFVFEAFTVIPLANIGGYSTNEYFTLPEVKLFFPILFLHYILEKIGQTKKYWLYLKIHYVLAFAILGLTIFNVLFYAGDGRTIYQLLDFQTIEIVFMVMQYYSFFLTIAAIGISINETLRYTRLVQNTYSDLDMLQIRWLWQFIFGVIPIVLVWGLELFRIALGGSGPSEFVSITWFLIIIFIYFLSFKAYQQKNLLERVPLTSRRSQEKKFINEDRPIKDYRELSTQLKTFMVSTKFYLNHDLTIYDLSKAINVSPRLISDCINRNFGFNFTEWINNFRVDDALIRLKESKYNHLSIEGVGLDSGFKSRSAMYAAFKKKTGQSPGYFRQA